MNKYRKIPWVIEAVQWTGKNYEEIEEFLHHSPEIRAIPHPRQLVIPTLEGDMAACPGDWIIKGVKGEFYPCKPDIFAVTYEPIA